MTIIILVAVLVGFIYLQSEIDGLKNPDSSNSTPSSNPNGSSSPQSNSTTPVTLTITTTTTYGGTTLVCNSQSYSTDGGKTIFYIIDANITNIGDATAYGVKLRIQGFDSNGTQAFDNTITLNDYYISVPWVHDPVNIPPGQTYHIPFTTDPDSKSNEPFGILLDGHTIANYVITPIWSSIPVN